MNKLRLIIQKIRRYFYLKTKKGKEEKYWEIAGKKLSAHLFEKGAQELKIKQNCISEANKILSKKRLSNFHLKTVLSKKFKKDLNEASLKIDHKTLRFKNA